MRVFDFCQKAYQVHHHHIHKVRLPVLSHARSSQESSGVFQPPCIAFRGHGDHPLFSSGLKFTVTLLLLKISSKHCTCPPLHSGALRQSFLAVPFAEQTSSFHAAGKWPHLSASIIWSLTWGLISLSALHFQGGAFLWTPAPPQIGTPLRVSLVGPPRLLLLPRPRLVFIGFLWPAAWPPDWLHFIWDRVRPHSQNPSTSDPQITGVPPPVHQHPGWPLIGPLLPVSWGMLLMMPSRACSFISVLKKFTLHLLPSWQISTASNTLRWRHARIH